MRLPEARLLPEVRQQLQEPEATLQEQLQEQQWLEVRLLPELRQALVQYQCPEVRRCPGSPLPWKERR